jgi:DNA-binding transcriptional regulator YiaG
MKAKKETCPECGSPVRRIRGDYDATKLFGIPVTLRNIEIHRSDCGDSPVIPRAAQINRALARAVIRKPYRLGGAEIRFLRKFLRMKGEDFARLIHVDRTTLSKWENDEDPVGDQSDRLIRAVTLGLGEGLQDELVAGIRAFPEIKSAVRRIRIEIEPESLTYEYA